MGSIYYVSARSISQPDGDGCGQDQFQHETALGVATTDTAEKHAAADAGTGHDGWLPQSVRRENVRLELAGVQGPKTGSGTGRQSR
jgi:hypothetical protein